MDIKEARIILSKLVGGSDSIPAVEALVSIFKALDEPVQQPITHNTSEALREIAALLAQYAGALREQDQFTIADNIDKQARKLLVLL